MNKAHCDLATGKIYGCEKGSKQWYHEKGHFVFNSDEKFSFLIMIRGYAYDAWLFFLMLAIIYKPFISTAITFWVIYFGIFIFEEHWCNRYSKKHFKPKPL